MHLAAVTLSAQVDPTNLAMVGLVALQAVVTWLLLFRRQARESGSSEGLGTAATANLVSSVTRITERLDEMEKWRRDHERETDKSLTRLEERQRQMAETDSHISRINENLQRQLLNLAAGLAPTHATPLPATRQQP